MVSAKVKPVAQPVTAEEKVIEESPVPDTLVRVEPIGAPTPETGSEVAEAIVEVTE
jgi:hypothetical protein